MQIDNDFVMYIFCGQRWPVQSTGSRSS